MVHLLKCSSAHTPLGPLVFSILLLLTSSMEPTFSDARKLPRRRLQEIDAIKGQEEAGAAETTTGETTSTMQTRRRSLIGSRPPRCERVCMSCGHCEAVQVPIVPEERRKKRARRQEQQQLVLGAALFGYRVNGITNYKPLSWKCKCGGAILDP